ncbi:hypothetical protein [Thioalkalivibrio sp. ALE23]|uniref:hypothetical protein n=1 Tax=Thioalkalivibrio sp. ALE23 TaxID=1265495 RepID=UPI0003736BE4|nr:hypothetical protein [Thioalkalivibrio sp. ALE23]
MAEWIEILALGVGYAVIVAGALALAAFVVFGCISYFWRRYGDVHALVNVVREARRQGRTIYREDKRDVDD